MSVAMDWNLFDKIDKKLTNIRKKKRQDSLDAKVRKIIAAAMQPSKQGIGNSVVGEVAKYFIDKNKNYIH